MLAVRSSHTPTARFHSGACGDYRIVYQIHDNVLVLVVAVSGSCDINIDERR